MVVNKGHNVESLFPNKHLWPLLLFFWGLKWTGYLAVAGLNLLAQSTNLYGSLRFGTNERVLLRRRYPTIASLCAPITTTKGEGYYVEFFLYVPSPWSRSQKRKGNQRGQMTTRSIY